MIRLWIGILIVAGLVLPPLVTTALDDHIFFEPDCPYCNLSQVFLLATVGAFALFVFYLTFRRCWLQPAVVILFRSRTGGLTAVRDPPLEPVL